MLSADDFKSYSKSSLITIFVGQGASTVELAAHEDQLYKSPFFEMALQKDRREGQTRKIELPDDHGDTVECYLDFLYTRKVPDDHHVDQLYVLGQKLLGIKFKNAVLARILQTAKRPEDSGVFSSSFNDSGVAIRIMYECTPSGSLGRQLLVDIFFAASESNKLEDDFHPEFTHDLLVKFMDHRSRPLMHELELAQYQEKAEEEDED